MISVERLLEFGALPPEEPPATHPKPPPPAGAPPAGAPTEAISARPTSSPFQPDRKAERQSPASACASSAASAAAALAQLRPARTHKRIKIEIEIDFPVWGSLFRAFSPPNLR